MPALIQLDNFNLGGWSDSKYLGTKNSVAALVGFDIHSEPGILKVNQKLTKDSGTTVDDFVKASVSCSDGNSYHFGSTNGKIWKRTSGGTWTLEATASPAAGAAGILDAMEYQGYIYYSMQSRLGRWQLGTAWSTRSDNFATFVNTDPDFHPMNIQNLVLYIGDKHYLAQVDAGTFSEGSGDVLDITQPHRMKALGKYFTDLVLGTYIAASVALTKIARWNTWSDSFSSDDDIPEVGVNAFLKTDNFLVSNGGTKGNLYIYTGTQLDQQKRIPGDWSGTKEAYVHPNSVENINGLPIFGLSNISGNPTLCGVWSYGRNSKQYPYVLNFEWPISTGNMTNVEVGAITQISSSVFLVAWKDTTSGTVYGVDKVDASNKYSGAYLESRVYTGDRDEEKEFEVVVAYRTLPTGTAIAVYASVNDAAYSPVTTVVDTDRKVVESTIRIAAASKLQIKVTTTASGNTAPEIEQVLVQEAADE